MDCTDPNCICVEGEAGCLKHRTNEKAPIKGPEFLPVGTVVYCPTGKHSVSRGKIEKVMIDRIIKKDSDTTIIIYEIDTLANVKSVDQVFLTAQEAFDADK